MKPRTAADVVRERIGAGADIRGIEAGGPGHAWYERVADGRATVTFVRDEEVCLGVGWIRDGEEWADTACVSPLDELDEPTRADIGLEEADVWQVPDDSQLVTVVRTRDEYRTRPERLAGASWVIDGFGVGITDIIVD